MNSHENCSHSTTRRAIAACEAQLAAPSDLNRAAAERRAAAVRTELARVDHMGNVLAEMAMHRDAAQARREERRFTSAFITERYV